MKKGEILITDKVVLDKIYLVRGQKVMIDRDLANLYGVETKRLKEAVKRNIERFPEDFMFEMTKDEFNNWRSQIATSNSEKMGLRYAPFCFTEEGVTMLSCILSSDTAIAVNIQIIRVFKRMREMLITHKDILLKLEAIEKKLLQHDHHLKKHEDEIQIVFEALKQLINPPPLVLHSPFPASGSLIRITLFRIVMRHGGKLSGGRQIVQVHNILLVIGNMITMFGAIRLLMGKHILNLILPAELNIQTLHVTLIRLSSAITHWLVYLEKIL